MSAGSLGIHRAFSSCAHVDAVEGLKKQYSQLQAKKQAIIQAIETEEREHDEMLRTNGELREQRNQLSVRLSQMKQQIEVLHAEISREGTSTCAHPHDPIC